MIVSCYTDRDDKNFYFGGYKNGRVINAEHANLDVPLGGKAIEKNFAVH